MFISTVEKGLNSQIITENCELVHNTVQHLTNYPFQAIGRYFRPLDYCTTYTFKKRYFRGNGDMLFMYNSLQTKTIGNSKFNVLIPC